MTKAIMVNMAKVNTREIAEKKGYPIEHVEGVVEEIIADKKNHRRQPKPPPPEGGISIRAAGRKYGMCISTLSRWTQRGYIPILQRTRNELYIDERVLGELVKKYKKAAGQGKQTIARIEVPP